MESEEFRPAQSILDPQPNLPSLQRLNAIDKEDKSFQLKLADIAGIIELPSDLLNYGSTGTTNFLPKQRHHSRLDWVLRWLLNKFQSDEEIGRQ